MSARQLRAIMEEIKRAMAFKCIIRRTSTITREDKISLAGLLLGLWHKYFMVQEGWVTRIDFEVATVAFLNLHDACSRLIATSPRYETRLDR